MSIKRKKPGPEPAKPKQKAHIEDWQEFQGCLVGRVSDHPRQLDFSHRTQVTSPLVSLDREKGTAETQNTVYTLGRELHNLL